jgi:hypothetical protein
VQIDFLQAELGIQINEAEDEGLDTRLSHTVARSISRPPSALASSSNDHDPFLVSTPTPIVRPVTLFSLSSKNLPGGFSSSVNNHSTRSVPDSEVDEQVFQHVFARYVAAHSDDNDDGDDSERARRSLIGLENVEPTPALLAWATRTRIELEDLKRRREAHIQTLYDQLEVLWRRL